MEVTHGTWGVRTRTFYDNNVLVTILNLKPFKRCSWHCHKHAYNQFYVIQGKLGVKTNAGPKDETQETIIISGQIFTVPPGIHHEFRTYELSTIVEEIAYVKYTESDINRKKLGGNMENIDG